MIFTTTKGFLKVWNDNYSKEKERVEKGGEKQTLMETIGFYDMEEKMRENVIDLDNK